MASIDNNKDEIKALIDKAIELAVIADEPIKRLVDYQVGLSSRMVSRYEAMGFTRQEAIQMSLGVLQAMKMPRK